LVAGRTGGRLLGRESRASSRMPRSTTAPGRSRSFGRSWPRSG